MPNWHLKAVNKQLVALYWDIGKLIVERQINADHGAAIAEQLAADLRQEFPGVSGYSRRNVFYMREFYLAYCDLPKVQPLVAQIGWTNNLIILQRCKDLLEHELGRGFTEKNLRRMVQFAEVFSDMEPFCHEPTTQR